MIAIRQEIREIETEMQPRGDNLLKNAPHTAESLLAAEWSHPYPRERAAYPLPYLRTTSTGRPWAGSTTCRATASSSARARPFQLLGEVPMASTTLTFASREAHRAWLSTQAILPAGFRVGTTRFEFVPVEVPKPAAMNLTLIALDKPTPDFAAVFTRNAFPGAPVIIGRRRLDEPTLGAIVVNNKISNVCAPDGVATAERLCAGVAGALGMAPGQVLPSSTGVIGWRIPIEACWRPCPPLPRPSANEASSTPRSPS
jgi:hypothetical protein